MSFISNFSTPMSQQTTITLTNNQWDIILEAIEDYGVLVSEDLAEKTGEILDIIEAELSNQN
jgi:hypothetical protein